jgi:hypothetical protein
MSSIWTLTFWRSTKKVAPGFFRHGRPAALRHGPGDGPAEPARPHPRKLVRELRTHPGAYPTKSYKYFVTYTVYIFVTYTGYIFVTYYSLHICNLHSLHICNLHVLHICNLHSLHIWYFCWANNINIPAFLGGWRGWLSFSLLLIANDMNISAFSRGHSMINWHSVPAQRARGGGLLLRARRVRRRQGHHQPVEAFSGAAVYEEISRNQKIHGANIVVTSLTSCEIHPDTTEPWWENK